MEIFIWLQAHLDEIVLVITSLVTAGSIIVKLTPTLRDDAYWLKVIKFIGKYIALNRGVNDDEIRLGNPPSAE